MEAQCLFPNIREAFFDRLTWLDDEDACGTGVHAPASSSEDRQSSGKGERLILAEFCSERQIHGWRLFSRKLIRLRAALAAAKYQSKSDQTANVACSPNEAGSECPVKT